MERAARDARFELGRGLRSLLTLALMAPLVGGLGAVAGLLNVSQGIALLGGFEIGPISEALAEALDPFQFALVIGIPSFWAYAYLRARIDRTAHAMEAAVANLD
jgi:biopolymer transport protein ExbB